MMIDSAVLDVPATIFPTTLVNPPATINHFLPNRSAKPPCDVVLETKNVREKPARDGFKHELKLAAVQ